MTFLKDPISSLTHFFGAVLSIFALVMLLIKASSTGNTMYILTFMIFGISLILLYSASTIYHAVSSPHWLSEILHKIDHMMIFVLIAGTYTPICFISLNKTMCMYILIAVWSLAIIGIISKLFWINMPRWISTGIYLLMGWIIIFAIFPLFEALTGTAMFWLFAGGISYTIGAIIYGTKRPKFATKFFGFHEIFHIFVLIGSFCHFLMIYNYLGL